MLKLTRRHLMLVGTLILGGIIITATIFVWFNLAKRQPLSPPISQKVTVEDFLGEPILASPQLIIDELGIHATIIPLGLNDQGNFADPTNPMEVGWYLGSPFPGSGDASSSALLDGHLTGPSGQPAIFADLHTLAPGDEIKIELAPDKILTYEVTTLHNLATPDIDLADYLTPTTPGKESLTIVTCAGDYDEDADTYTKRLIVQAVLN